MTGIFSFDATYYGVVIFSVFLVGMAKGGLGGTMGMLGVPVMSLVMSPIQAAAILLPILLVMDAVSLWSWRGHVNWRLLRFMLPGALIGISVGWLTASILSDAFVRLLVGAVAFSFALRWLSTRIKGGVLAPIRSKAAGIFWASLSGLTSFVAHSGGPPFQVYVLPLRMEPKLYVGTSVVFFAIVNAIKLIPYAALGQFDTENLEMSLLLVPVAILATFVGVWIAKRIKAEVFYPFMYVMLFLISLKLIWDGIAGLS